MAESQEGVWIAQAWIDDPKIYAQNTCPIMVSVSGRYDIGDRQGYMELFRYSWCCFIETSLVVD